ncbi:hypothetical protein GCM10010358_81780 [Streptomyces minutiscleroticus]|uniref:DUF4158 domain-containing protein n=1 Tax=Streptomyces minutiscleroticus TaxID=68238 RepID=A0A918P3E9_9ACTN|nr:DUF4158 domain-containing protein [Streptomyces minutiscleroticus]GGY18135.1 hypothetical protein GCM10010358_81780 [Streptomyces minutiscleroticus]
MPSEFLTDEQTEADGKLAEEPTRPELERFFFLDDVDRDLIARRRSTHHRLGFALQMCTVRYIGRFLPDDPLDAPWPVAEHLAAQLGIEDPSVVKRYTDGRRRRTSTRGRSGTPTRTVSTTMQGGPGGSAPSCRPALDARRGPEGAVRPRGGLAAPSPSAAVGSERAGPAGGGGADGRGETAARHGRGGPSAGGPGAARGSGGDAEDAGGVPVLGAGAAAPAADADDGYRRSPARWSGWTRSARTGSVG